MTEPQQIGSGIGLALNLLKSQPVCYETTEEAERAWKLSKAAHDLVPRLIAGGYPERAITNLPKMFGPGLECAKELLPRLLTPGGIVFLIGDRGPGKTQMATWFAAEMVKDGMTCGLYRKSLDLFGEIRGSWKQGAPKSEEEVIRTFKKARFLVIDEAQERGDTDSDRQWCDRMITHIIDHRYDSMLSTLIVANLNKQSYETTIPSSIRSRVAECGGVKACDWASYRA